MYGNYINVNIIYLLFHSRNINQLSLHESYFQGDKYNMFNTNICYLYYDTIFLLNKLYNMSVFSDSLLIYKSKKAYVSYKLNMCKVGVIL